MAHSGTFKPGNPYRIKKGETRNPGGKPKIIIDVARAARECTTEAIETLKKAMAAEKAPWAARVNAACALLDRGWGRAPQHIEITRRTDPKSLTDEQLAAIAAGGIEPPTSGAEPPASQSDPKLLN